MYYLIIKKYEIILYFIYIIVFLIKFIGKVFLGLVLFYEFYIAVLNRRFKVRKVIIWIWWWMVDNNFIRNIYNYNN